MKNLKLLPLLLLLASPAMVQAQFTFTTNNGAITITGYNTAAGLNAIIPATTNGHPVTDIADYAFAFGASTRLKSVIIGDNVTNIGEGAFENCSGLTNAAIGKNVVVIRAEAFGSCTSLTNIAIPNSVADIGWNAFYNCTSLTNVIIGNSVTNIGSEAFMDCISLKTVTIPATVISIGDSAFIDCPRLTNIAVDAANPVYSSLGGVLFDNAQATLIQFPGGLGGVYTIPNSVTNIGDYAFENCGSIASVTIPNSVVTIGNQAFTWCLGLTNATIGDNVTIIGDGAFQACPLKDLVIGNRVTSVGDCAFAYCSSLTTVLFGESVSYIGYDAFNGCSSLTGLTIPNSVTNIEDYSFYDCPRLAKVIIGESVSYIGYAAFYNCPSLTNITVNAGNSAYSSLSGVLFDSAQATLIQFPSGLNGVYTIPNSVTSIGDYAFEDCGLTRVTVPNSVTNMGYEAFYDCPTLTSAYFLGDGPPDDGTAFTGDFNNDPATVYYLSGTSGWSSSFGGVPAVLWNPEAQCDFSLGVRTNQFGFSIIGGSNLVIVVVACTNLANPVWFPVSTNTLNTFVGTNGTSYFSDPQWTNSPCRFYRFRSP